MPATNKSFSFTHACGRRLQERDVKCSSLPRDFNANRTLSNDLDRTLYRCQPFQVQHAPCPVSNLARMTEPFMTFFISARIDRARLGVRLSRRLELDAARHTVLLNGTAHVVCARPAAFSWQVPKRRQKRYVGRCTSWRSTLRSLRGAARRPFEQRHSGKTRISFFPYTTVVAGDVVLSSKAAPSACALRLWLHCRCSSW